MTDEPFIFLSLDDVLAIHAEQLELFGGAEGMIDRNVVEAATMAPQQTMFGEYLNPDVPTIAAAYLHGFATTQGFRDGNKRTAAEACVWFLARNGYRLTCTPEEFFVIASATAQRQRSKEQVADWIADHMEPID